VTAAVGDRLARSPVAVAGRGHRRGMVWNARAIRALITDERDEQALMARGLALIVLGGVAIVAWWLRFGEATEAHRPAVAAVSVAEVACAAVLLALPAHLLSVRVRSMTLATLSALISAGVFFTGVPDSGFELFFVWSVPYAYVAFSARQAAGQTAWMASCLAAALVAQRTAGGQRPAEVTMRWALTVASVTIIGVLMGVMAECGRERDARFRRGFEDSPLGVALIGSDLRYLEVNDALCAIHGRSAEELRGLTLDDVTHPDDVGLTRDIVGALSQSAT
jgi:PAS domain-containing protein